MHSLDEVFGPDYLFCPGVMLPAKKWLPPTPESLTGGQLTTFRHTPCLCHAGAATPAGLALLAECRHQLPTTLDTYTEESDLINRLKYWIDNHKILIFNHLQLNQAIPIESLWVDPALINRLNPQGHLADWASRAETAHKAGRFLPLSTFDPSISALETPHFVSRIVNGENEQDIRHFINKHLRLTPRLCIAS